MKKSILFSLAIATGFSVISCNGGKTTADGTKQETEQTTKDDKLKDDKLSSFMLGGIYFIQGYGGQSAVNDMIKTDDQKEIVNNYKELLEFPFKPEDGSSDAQRTLKSWWDINDKAGLEKVLEKLKVGDAKNPHKAWDYARLVNNACMGYAAGYLTKDEVEKHVTSTLPLAQKAFKTWDDYYADFNEGRKVWAGDPSGDKAFADLSKEITKGNKSIYQILPLN
jgi:hypothetical protein